MNPTPPPVPPREGVLLDAQNPWPGLWSYTEENAPWFHGRDRERDALFALVQREPLSILFGASGLGKTSLLLAGLFPRLRDRDALPVRIRLDYRSPVSLGTQILQAFAAGAAATSAAAPAPLAGETLWEYFHRRAPGADGFEMWSQETRLLTPVLVLDQFEELFTLARDAADPEIARKRFEAFIDELAALVQNVPPPALRERFEKHPEERKAFGFDPAPVRVLLSLREDFVADLDDLRPYLRAVATCRLRLNAFPHHPLVLLCQAEAGTHGDPAWLTWYAASRLLAEPHYLTPLGPPREDPARAHELTLGLATDCHLAARLLQRQKRPELAAQVLARARKLAPDNPAYRDPTR
jgi:hypothetical protein